MDTDLKMAATGLNGCEGCHHCTYAGIRWPASPDGYNDLSYVDRCDTCELYDSDEDAAKALAKHLGLRWGYAYRTAHDEHDIRWEPKENDGLSYTGWSAMIDHPARDGDPEHIREGSWQTITLNPGEARVLLSAIQELSISMASEWASGELFAISERKTLDFLYEEIGAGLHAVTK
jgi:hypothetical protein